jgi:hypothetical protein
MNHLFVPYEVAVKLKEKGFDELCLAWYNSKKTLYAKQQDGMGGYMSTMQNAEVKVEGYCTAPLYQQVFQWFRDRHKKFVSIQYTTTTQKDFVITINKRDINDARDEEYQTYEEAELAAIKYLINSI